MAGTAANDDKRVAVDPNPASSQPGSPIRSSGAKTTNSSGQKYSSIIGPRTIEPRQNPLGQYSSYTYNITLYMATPEAINNFVETGQFDPNDDFFIVAQSGGVGSEQKRGITIDGNVGPNEP